MKVETVPHNFTCYNNYRDQGDFTFSVGLDKTNFLGPKSWTQSLVNRFLILLNSSITDLFFMQSIYCKKEWKSLNYKNQFARTQSTSESNSLKKDRENNIYQYLMSTIVNLQTSWIAVEDQ